MTIRSAEGSGIDMRRALLIGVLLFSLLLTGCGRPRFSVTESGYMDKKTDRHYVALSSAFEAAQGGETVGEYVDETYGRVVTFRVIPGADAARFLTDEDGAVYCADAQLPDVATWKINAISVCLETMISEERERITDAALIAQISALWFGGEATETPLEDIVLARRLRVSCDDYPAIFYCFNFYTYADGSSYFYDFSERRAVAVPAELAEKIPVGME